MKVTKFGGSSLANAFQIQKVCNILLADEDRRIMVVSAPGKRTKDDTKVTDLLIAVAKARLAGESYDKEVAAAALAVAEERGVYRRMHDRRLAPVEPPYPFGDESAVRDELVNRLGALQVFAPEPRSEEAHRELPKRARVAVVVVVQIPQIAHGRVAVAYVPRALRLADPLDRPRLA